MRTNIGPLNDVRKLSAAGQPVVDAYSGWFVSGRGQISPSPTTDSASVHLIPGNSAYARAPTSFRNHGWRYPVIDFHLSATVDHDRLHRSVPYAGERVGVLEVGVERRHDDARFHGDQIDADERDPDPSVDHDALVEHAIQYVDQAARC